MITITGTSGAPFTTVVETSAGAIGFRSLGHEGFRVRVVPANNNGTHLNLSGWKQIGEDGQNRYSKVVDNKEALELAVRQAAKELVIASLLPVSDVDSEDEEEEDTDY
jgi:hypothetical protein